MTESPEVNEASEKTPRQRMTFKRQVKRMVILLAGAYVLLALIAAVFSERILFQPHASSYEDSTETIKLTTADGATISAWYFPNENARFTLLHSHGNGEDMGDLRAVYLSLCSVGFNVLAYDYHGYGTSEGTPSEANAYLDINAAYAYLTEELNVPPERIIVLGRSVGGGPSVDLAARQPVAALVLESAFVSVFRAAFQIPLLPWDKFENLKKLAAVRCPILVVHGESDWIVPAWHGHRLYASAPGIKQCLWVPKAGHNDLFFVAGDQYLQKLQEFAAGLESQDGPAP